LIKSHESEPFTKAIIVYCGLNDSSLPSTWRSAQEVRAWRASLLQSTIRAFCQTVVCAPTQSVAREKLSGQENFSHAPAQDARRPASSRATVAPCASVIIGALVTRRCARVRTNQTKQIEIYVCFISNRQTTRDISQASRARLLRGRVGVVFRLSIQSTLDQ